MRNWKSWIWPGVVTVACLAALALWFRLDIVETDLEARSVAALAPGHGWAGVALDGRDLTLQGLAPDAESQAEALEIARGTYGVRVVIDETGLLPEQSPYAFSLEKTENGLVLSGYAPDMATRERLVAMTSQTLPGIALLDQLKLARGAPDGFAQLIAFGSSAFSRFSTGRMKMTGTALSISGQALNPEDHEIAIELLSAPVPGNGTIESLEIAPAPANGDYRWSADLDGDTFILRGYVPDLAVREALVEAAASSRADVEVVDEMRFASGVPESVDWLDAARQAIGLVSSMTEGRVSLRDEVMDISGDISDGAAYRSLQDRLDGGLAGGARLGTVDIGFARVSPYVWTAALSSDGLMLEGYVPSQDVADRLVEAARLKLGTLMIGNGLEIAAGAPDGFADAAMAALQGLSRLDGAVVTFSDRDVVVSGEAYNPAAAGEIAREFDDELPEAFSMRHAIAPKPLPAEILSGAECQDRLDRITSANSVLFDTGEARIQYHSHGYLDRIAFTARQCPDVRLEISGHTDADGEEAANLALSEGRAEAVLSYISAAGVATDRLVPVGHGETRPVADNQSEAGKAANRRIEFRIAD